MKGKHNKNAVKLHALEMENKNDGKKIHKHD